MCGIAGAISRDRGAGDLVRRMLPAMARRGPDGEGIHEWPGVALGHRRLSILDLSPAGAQPMLSTDGRTGVTFNGCIYNFREIRSELESRGRRFRSQCDTEILVEGYMEWGLEKLLPRLHGMFAFAIWDDKTQTLSMARDRLGVKPLLYAETDGGLLFASTLKALRGAGAGGSVDVEAVREFLELAFVTDRRCILEGVKKLPPGHFLEWRQGQSTVRKYWDLPSFGDGPATSFENAVEETERLLVEAVRLRLISDVPIGTLLSGGIDSGLVCWALKKLNSNVRAFTVGVPGDPTDESNDAATVARQLGIEHEVVQIDQDAAAPLDELNAAYDEPFASTSALGVLRVSRSVRSKATVLLTGDGGDDVFPGYRFFLTAWQAQLFANRTPRFVASMWPLLRPLVAAVPKLSAGRNFLDYALGGIGPFGRVRDKAGYFEDQGMMGPALGHARPACLTSVPASFDSARRLLADVFQYHRTMHFTSEFLPKVDGGTMYYSLEARAPFMDQKLWEFAATLPGEVHLRGGQMKAVLREIARRHLGPEVAFRRKQGFTVPVERWLATHWKGELEVLRGPNALTRNGWFDQRSLSRAVEDAVAAGSVPNQLWYLIVLENWMSRGAPGRG